MSDKTPERIAHYEIVRLIGRGGMGVLYQARDTVSGREVALKVMSADILEDEHARARFRQEAQLAARHHRNIVKVFEFGDDGDLPFIAMEFLRGRSLADRLASGDPIPFETKLDIVTQVCDGLQCLHEEGIVHRDVKPANIWLLEDGGVKLLDLGIAKHGSVNLTQYGNVVGSVAYIAPEQLSGARVDGRADIFSAGVVLFEILSGQRPFHAESITAVMMKVLHEPPPDIRALVPSVPDDVARAVETALQKDPAARYAEAAEFASDLRLARALSQAPLSPMTAVTVATTPQVEPLGTTILSPRATAGETAPAVDHDPVLRSRPSVPVQAGPRRGRRSIELWAAGAVGLVVLGAFAWWMRTGPAPSETVQIEVRSVPAGAAISFDGVPTKFRTPAVVQMTPRPRTVGLALDGYEPVDASIAPTAASPISVQHTLRRLLQVRSEPAGAQILLDGFDTGQVTPAEIRLENPRSSRIELRLTGFASSHVAITPEAVDAGSVNVRLVAARPPTGDVAGTGGGKAPGTPGGAGSPGVTVPAPSRDVAVSLSGPYPFEVKGCGASSSASERHSLKVQLPCKLQLLAPAYFLDVEREVVAPEGGHIDLAAPPVVQAELRSINHDCRVTIAGKDLGHPTVRVEMVAGSHSAVLLCPGGKKLQTKPFEVKTGKWTSIDEYYR